MTAGRGRRASPLVHACIPVNKLQQRQVPVQMLNVCNESIHQHSTRNTRILANAHTRHACAHEHTQDMHSCAQNQEARSTGGQVAPAEERHVGPTVDHQSWRGAQASVHLSRASMRSPSMCMYVCVYLYMYTHTYSYTQNGTHAHTCMLPSSHGPDDLLCSCAPWCRMHAFSVVWARVFNFFLNVLMCACQRHA